MGPPPGGPPPRGRHPGRGAPPINTSGGKLTFLRGIQRADADGMVRLGTIFPRIAEPVAHTGQVFFAAEAALSLMQSAPYDSKRVRRTPQAEDGIFLDQSGAVSTAALQPMSGAAALIADLTVAVDPTVTPAPVRRGPPR